MRHVFTKDTCALLLNGQRRAERRLRDAVDMSRRDRRQDWRDLCGNYPPRLVAGDWMLAIGACFLVCRRSGTPLGAQEIELVLEGHGRERSGLRLRCTNPPQIPHSMNERALRAWHLLKCDESGLAGWVQGNPCLYIRLRTWRAGEVPGRPARCYRATAAAVGTPTLAVRAVGAPIVRTDCAGQHGGASCCSRWFGLSCGPASTSRVFTTITTRSGYSFHKFKRLGIRTSHSHPTVLSVNVSRIRKLEWCGLHQQIPARMSSRGRGNRTKPPKT